MAKKRRWSRYQPPADRRDENGGRVSPPRQAADAASRSTSSRSSGSSRSTSEAKPKPQSKPGAKAPQSTSASESKLSSWIRALIALAVIVPIVVIIIVAVKAGGGDSNPNPDLDTDLLNREFIANSLALALEVEGKDAVALRLDQYGMSVEYFDPNARQRRLFETNDYVEGYTLRVEESYYDEYMPRPFDLAIIDADTMIAAVNDALTRTHDIYTYRLLIEADRETGEVSMVVDVDGEDSVEVTSAP